MARVVAFKQDGKPQAVALELLTRKKTLKVGDVTLGWTSGQSTALGSARIADGRDVGSVTAQRMVDGEMKDIAYDVTFAFVVNAFHPDLRIMQE